MIDRGNFAWVFVVVAISIGLFALCMAEDKQRQQCKAKGGQWMTRYKQTGICLKPGSIIE